MWLRSFLRKAKFCIRKFILHFGRHDRVSPFLVRCTINHRLLILYTKINLWNTTPLNRASLKNNGIPDCVPIKTITQRNRMYSRWIRRWVGRWLVGVTIIKPPSLINTVFFLRSLSLFISVDKRNRNALGVRIFQCAKEPILQVEPTNNENKLCNIIISFRQSICSLEEIVCVWFSRCPFECSV